MHIVDGSPIGTTRRRYNDAGAAIVSDHRVLDEEHAALSPLIENALCCVVSDHHVLEEDRGRGLNADAEGSCKSGTLTSHAANFDALRRIVCRTCDQIDEEAFSARLNNRRDVMTVDRYRREDCEDPEVVAPIQTPYLAIDLGLPERARKARARVGTAARIGVTARPRHPTDKV